MQKWKVCKKLMAVILTLCMALPLISNQYLVVRAEETGTGTTDTKKLSDLIAAGEYVSVDLTKGEDVTLTKQTWTTDSYEYVASYYQEGDNTQKQTSSFWVPLPQPPAKAASFIFLFLGNFRDSMDTDIHVPYHQVPCKIPVVITKCLDDFSVFLDVLFVHLPNAAFFEIPQSVVVQFRLEGLVDGN